MSIQLRSGHPKCWAAAQRLGRFTLKELADAVPGGTISIVRPHMHNWLALDIVRVVREAGPHVEGIFETTGKQPPLLTAATTAADPQTNMWRAMRGLRTFSAVDVSGHASLPGCEVSEADASRYCRALVRVGIVRLVRGGNRNRAALYRLARNLGPLAPRIKRVEVAYDPNAEVHHLPEGVGS